MKNLPLGEFRVKGLVFNLFEFLVNAREPGIAIPVQHHIAPWYSTLAPIVINSIATCFTPACLMNIRFIQKILHFYCLNYLNKLKNIYNFFLKRLPVLEKLLDKVSSIGHTKKGVNFNHLTD